jgi:dolichyl-phosphate-mannose--protein O-mannosyl transferase
VRPTARAALVWVCLLAGAQALFLTAIDTPRTYDFDESHYVPAAQQLMAGRADPNPEHPPLGKLLIGPGISLFGDRPLGWRVMSTLFGTLTLAGMYAWGLALFRDRRVALCAALLTLVNHLLYVQARIAMLDTFAFAFQAWALAAFTAAWTADDGPDRQRRDLARAGWMLGCGVATKWSGLFPWAACLGLMLVARRRRHLSAWDVMRTLIVGPVIAYAVCFVPRLVIEHHGPWYTLLADFVDMQTAMYDAQRRVPGQHAYMSQWYQWPLLQRPIWYAFEPDGAQVRGVVLLGNPAVMWGGMVALVVCAADAIRRRAREPFLILFFYLAFLLPWIVVPRRLSLYYYYYPAGMTLSFALAYALAGGAQPGPSRRRVLWAAVAVAAAVFAYFFPILSGMPLGSGEFARWMWFRTWI